MAVLSKDACSCRLGQGAGGDDVWDAEGEGESHGGSGQPSPRWSALGRWCG